ncbi:MAG: hypothetical protein O3A88_03065 [Proteobacteria bacterium]|nr:hypothetical protein [Pseudomonadota bacterium]
MTESRAWPGWRWVRTSAIHAQVFLLAAAFGLVAYGLVFLLVRLERFILG